MTLPTPPPGRLRIALVAPPFVRVPPAGYGGTERVIHELARAFVVGGHEVVLFASGDSSVPGARTESLFARPVWPPTWPAERAHAAFAAARIADRGFDVVHSHTPATLLHADAFDPPIVHTIHHERAEPASALYARVAARVTFVCISARQRALFAEQLRGDVVVIHHGLDPDAFLAGAGGDHALFLARLDEVKGPHLAIDAAAAAGVPIDVAGRPHESAYYDLEVAPRLEHPGVLALGEVSGEAKRRALAGAGVLLFTSTWDEPFGLSAIEALLSGTPVVALARGALPEIVEPGLTGFLADTPAALAALVRPALALDRRRVLSRARERFSARRMADEHLALFRRLTARAPTPTFHTGGP